MCSLQETFFRQFHFDVNKVGWVGVEREAFLRPIIGGPVLPQAPAVCKALDRRGLFLGSFGPELSACQIEFRTEPVPYPELEKQLTERETHLRSVCGELGLYLDLTEVAEANMSTKVYPDRRYQAITELLSPEVLLAACRVAGTHIHVGMPDLVTAISVYDKVISYTSDLIALGDGSRGERMRLYRIVAPQCDPLAIGSVGGLYERAVAEGFVTVVRNWWSLIRITRYGTIEFRMFGNTLSVAEVCFWAKRCRELCLAAL